MALKTFKLGGVHPEENKLSASQAIEALPLPKKAFVPLSQHLGSPAKSIVQKGDAVKTGQLIAQAEGFISANIHSPFTGKVSRIDDYPDQSGYRRPAIYIDVDPVDQWVDGIDLSPELKEHFELEPAQIIDRVKSCGIVGLGGATFPTHVKLLVPTGKKAEVLIINGVECEPYLTSDHRLMLEKADEMIVGIRIMMKALGVRKANIGIENNKQDAIIRLRHAAAKYTDIRVTALKVKYPQGGEKQLIKAITGREVPSGKLPIEVGCVVQNVGTAIAIYEAVQKNKPLIERVVTVTGKALAPL
jgi:Na+-translocating ferredoxin:NAD+ oxidoreductase subunit C